MHEEMSNTSEQGDDMPTHLGKWKSSTNSYHPYPNGSILIDEFYVATLIASLPPSWAHVTQQLEIKSTIMPAELTTCIPNEIIKCCTEEESLLNNITAFLTS
ncbi:hypothetical protein CROQUDRAFT_97744 [Cronartium quercuum f. sp. fusiforme G11]|uniref:Uncharacterized protein n=1 Tax=Cronartium quercuum f. sp. fusiforme G11 TaxID=708437 RepID=A0A9P6T7T6_9BASI|nr:hypothetical protein CROQUDRAFT_97744 [Cronartium quercuum f. sp. fusiforme G11]